MLGIETPLPVQHISATANCRYAFVLKIAFVIPAKAGIQVYSWFLIFFWILTSARMTMEDKKRGVQEGR